MKCRYWIISILIAACGMTGYEIFRPRPAVSVEALLNREFNHHHYTERRLARYFRDQNSLDQSLEQAWKAAEEQVMSACGSPSEVQAILKSVRFLAESKRRASTIRLYIIPAYARRDFVQEHPVWVFGFGWEYKQWLARTISPPHHVWFVILDSISPYKMLGEQQCG